MIEEIPMDDYDNEAYDNDEDDLYNTAFGGEKIRTTQRHPAQNFIV